MLWRGNEGENRPDAQTGTIEPKDTQQQSVSRETMSREELLASDPKAKEMYERLRDLRKSVDAISNTSEQPETSENKQTQPSQAAVDAAKAKAAEEAVKRKAREEALLIKQRAEAAKAKELKQKLQLEEANRRAAMKQLEAERKRKQAALAEREAREAAQRQSAETAAAAIKVKQAAALQQKKIEEAKRIQEAAARKADAEAKAAEQKLQEALHNETMDALKEELLSTQQRQDAILGKISAIADRSTVKLTESQQSQIQEMTEAQQKAKLIRQQQRMELQRELERSRAERARDEQIRKAQLKAQNLKMQRENAEKALEIQQAKAEQAELIRKQEAEKLAKAETAKKAKALMAAKAKAEKQARELAIKQAKAEKQARELAAKKAKAEEEARIREERKDKARALWKEREEKRQAERREKLLAKQKAHAEKIRLQEQKDRLKLARKKELDEMARLELLRQEDAARGGGLVTVHDMTIKTEINKRAEFNLRDLLGLKTKEEKNAKTEEERLRLKLDREIRTEEARAKFTFNRMLSKNAFKNSFLGKKLQQFEKYCADNRKRIITVSSAIATIAVMLAAGFNYFTGYEYSYNGATLGIVKAKDDVLRVTDLVQGALAEDTNMDVVIDAKDDISFKRVWTVGDVEIDTTDDVLKRLTYMSNFKVASYGIYVDGKKIGAMKTSSEVQMVLEDLKSKYANRFKNAKTTTKDSEITQAVFLEKVDVKECNTKLSHIYSKDEMMSLLTTSKEKETVHTSVAGETVKDIADEYTTTQKDILKNNPDLPKEGEVPAGTAVVIKEFAPVVTVRLTEEATYDEVIKHEVKETKSDQMYEGDTEVTKEGKDGQQEVTAEIITVNGREISREPLITKVTSEPVTEEVTVGTAERPPTVGDGVFAWPLKCKFHQTTGFEMRWGRFHKGLDLACPKGNTVYAADGGTVICARYKPSYGNLVVIDHQNGYTTKYAHNSGFLVKEGDKVYEGQPIALVGSTGNSTGPHCHFEIRYNDVPKNPYDYLPDRDSSTQE